MTGLTATLHEDLRTFMIIPCLIILRIRTVSHKFV